MKPANSRHGPRQRQFLRNPDEPALYEALLRLRGADSDLILPKRFLPSAEPSA